MRENGIATCQFRSSQTGSLGRSQPRRLGCRALAFARLVGRETRYEPRAEERDRLVAEVLGVSGQVIAISLVEPDIEWAHQTSGLDFLREQQGVCEHEAIAEYGVLRGELRSVEHQAPITS